MQGVVRLEKNGGEWGCILLFKRGEVMLNASIGLNPEETEVDPVSQRGTETTQTGSMQISHSSKW